MSDRAVDVLEVELGPPEVVHRLEHAAAGVIAFHVVDDNFIQPESGMAASDHLASGLIPLAALALAALFYRRLRAGARASSAALVGIFGLVAGLEGWHYLSSATARGDDFSSLAALPTGLVLLALATWVLWRSRRTDDSTARRYARRTAKGAGVVAFGAVVVVPLLLAYAYTHLARGHVPKPNLGAVHEDVAFETADGLTLQGWYIPSHNGAAVISFPGRAGTQGPARLLADHGYGVLLFDRRGEGEATESRTRADGAAIATSMPPFGSSSTGASTHGGSAASGSPWAAR